MKRILSILLLICFLFSGCANTSSEESSHTASSSESMPVSSSESSDPASEQPPKHSSMSESESEPENSSDESDPATSAPSVDLPEAVEIERPENMETGANVENGNLFQYRDLSDFQRGTRDHCVVSSTFGGAVMLSKSEGLYVSSGVYTGAAIETKPFDRLIVTCNADIPMGASVELQARVRTTGADGSDVWSEWLSYGVYSPFWPRESVGQANEMAYMNLDTLFVREKQANAFQFRVLMETM